MELKPCPFCGRAARLSYGLDALDADNYAPCETVYVVAMCCSCGIRTPKFYYSEQKGERSEAEKMVIKRWNRRVDGVPTKDVQPVVHGMWLSREYIYGNPNTGIEDEWIEHPAKQSNNYAYCSVCKEKAGYDWEQNLILSDYCPNCGVMMDLNNNK